MKFKAPADTGSCNIGGQHYEIVDGILEVPDNGNFIGLLSSHGFTFISSDAAEQNEEKTDDSTDTSDQTPATETSGQPSVDDTAATVTKAQAKAKVKADKAAKAAANQG